MSRRSANPADKDQIVAHATNIGASEEMLRLLRGLPVAVYDRREQVIDASEAPAIEQELGWNRKR